MFKNLMSKVEEAKKITASVGEQITQQVGDQIRNLNEANNDSGGITRRLKTAIGVNADAKDLSPSKLDGLDSIPEGDLLGLDIPKRERRWSGDSNMSVESSVSTFFQSIPGMLTSTLETLDSDQESVVEDSSSTLIKSASKEQISTVLSKLQGRAANYKDKYRDLVKQYNSLVAENNKCRTVLAQTQDKALTRIEKLRGDKKVLAEKLKESHERLNQGESPSKHQKLEELLEKCKAEINKNRLKLKELSDENDKLKAPASESADGVSEEWNERINKVEEDWMQRLNQGESDHALQLATTKAEMHGALEIKDREIESWRAKCRTLEIQDGQANERWQKKVDDLQEIVKALEAEKTDMIEKLSTAKQQGVQAVREEEEQKRSEMMAEFKEREQKFQNDLENKLEEITKQHAVDLDKLHLLMKDQNIPKATSEDISNHDELLSQMKASISELECKLAEKEDEMKVALEHSSQRQRDEVAALISEHEEIITQTRQQNEVERAASVSKLEYAQNESDHLRKKVESLQKELDQQVVDKSDEAQKKEKLLTTKINELQDNLAALQLKSTTDKEEFIVQHNKEKRGFDTQIENLQQQLDTKISELQELTEKAVVQQNEYDVRITELTTMLDEKTEALRQSEAKRDEIQRDLEAAKELSAMHEHLRSELEETRKQRDLVEVKVLELISRAESAEKALEEDRTKLANEKRELEESFTKSTSNVLESSDLPSFDQLGQANDETRAEEHSQTVSELNNEIAALQKKIENLIQEKDKLASEFNLLRSTADSEETLKVDLDIARERIKQLQDDVNSHSDLYNKLQNETNELICSLKQQVEEKESSLGELSTELAEKIEILNSLSGSNDTLSKKVQELGEVEIEIRKQLVETESGLEKLNNELVNVRDEKKLLEEEICQLREEQNVSVKAYEERILLLKSTEEKFSDAESEIRIYKDKIAALEKSEEQFSDQLKERNEKINELETELHKKQNDLQSIEENMVSQIHKIEELDSIHKQELANKDNEYSKLEEEISSLKNDLKSFGQAADDNASKENIITELRKSVDDAREETAKKQVEYEAKVAELQGQLSAELDGKKAADLISIENQREIESLKQSLEDKESNHKKMLEEEQTLREQYASALENVRNQLEDAVKENSALSTLRSEKESIAQNLSDLSEEYKKYQLEQEEKFNAEVKNLTQKAESNLNKMKQNSEKDIAAAKAELMLQIDELRASISEKDRKLDDGTLERAKLEQQLISLSSVKEELDEKKEKEKKLSSKVTDQEHKIIELEADNKLLKDKKSDLELQREDLNTKINDFENKVKELQLKVGELEEFNADGLRKAAAKQDTDSKKVIRELQKEVKQLYMELNEKTEALDKLKAENDVKEESAVQKTVSSQNKSLEKDYMYEEELENMRKRLNDSHKEIDHLRERNELLQRSIDSHTKNNSPATISVNGGDKKTTGYDDIGFAHSAEAEYLKNVLYRYMAERETLGKECVTLARVIGTVAKFDKRQLDVVLSKEESRVSTWVEGTVNQVSHVLGGAR